MGVPAVAHDSSCGLEIARHLVTAFGTRRETSNEVPPRNAVSLNEAIPSGEDLSLLYQGQRVDAAHLNQRQHLPWGDGYEGHIPVEALCPSLPVSPMSSYFPDSRSLHINGSNFSHVGRDQHNHYNIQQREKEHTVFDD
ncbi:hypothetical protein PQX77_018306, partial [Marasmius sp. AFHP31]